MEIYNILINIEIKYKGRKQDKINNNRKVEVWILL